nr:MAG TPA: hypothetical protein [Caudoviricetes sp.]
MGLFLCRGFVYILVQSLFDCEEVKQCQVNRNDRAV